MVRLWPVAPRRRWKVASAGASSPAGPVAPQQDGLLGVPGRAGLAAEPQDDATIAAATLSSMRPEAGRISAGCCAWNPQHWTAEYEARLWPVCNRMTSWRVPGGAERQTLDEQVVPRLACLCLNLADCLLVVFAFCRGLTDDLIRLILPHRMKVRKRPQVSKPLRFES